MSLKPPKRKGCLIALLVLVLLSALLYTHCAFAPTGYQKIVESNRSARERLWNKRFASPAPSPTGVLSQTGSTSSTSPAITSEEYARLHHPENGLDWFWVSVNRNFGWRGTLSGSGAVSASGAVFYPGLTGDMYPSTRVFFEDRMINSHKRGLESRLERLKEKESSSRKPEQAETDPTAWMDLMESRLAEDRWDRADFLDLSCMKDCEDAQVLLRSEKTCLALFRALRHGDPAKAAQLIERYVQLAGKTLLVEPDGWMAITLEPFLFELASEPKAPEAMLDWIAAALASWKLDPQEYRDLQVASIIRSRDLWVAGLRASLDPQSNRYWQYRTNWTDIPFKSLEKAGVFATEPLLWKAIDRKTEALINQDAAEYLAAHRQMEAILKTIRFVRKEGVTWRDGIRGGINLSWVGLLEDNGLIYDTAGQLLENGRKETNPANGDSATTETAFSFLLQGKYWYFGDSSRESFNRWIEVYQFVFASARYYREHGRYPASVRDLIPRYLDESFASSPEPEITLETIAPFDQIVLPEFGYDTPPSLFTRTLAAYRNDPHNGEKWPASIEDLKPYAKPGEDLAPYAGCFVHFDELPLFCIPSFAKWRPNDAEVAGPQKYVAIHAMFPPLNLDGVPGYLPSEPKEGKGL
ncbi:MAG TPA: hypothetical protein PKH31_07730 [Candidatus Sumerlaeota bacterium]|nr:hypothetical protein [Candidatus Sumerlaeota bacterium]